VPDVGEGVDRGQRALGHRALRSSDMRAETRGEAPISVRIPPRASGTCSRNGRAFDAMAKVRPREANASRPGPPRRGVARREGFLVRLVDGIANRQWLRGFAHRTTNRPILIDRDGGARRGCAVGLHESYDDTLRRMPSGFVCDAPRGGLDSSYLAPVDPRNRAGGASPAGTRAGVAARYQP
jgi:hypothetical protein